MKKTGKILIADDHEVYRYGLGLVLRRHFKASGVVEAHGFDDAIEQLADPTIFLALFDLGMPRLKSPLDLERVRRLRPDVRLLVVSGSEAREDILAALQAGVHGYLVKNVRTDEVLKRIEQVLAGEIYVPPILSEVARDATPAVDVGHSQIASLTERQRDVLKLIARGLSNKEIGRELNISEGTVKMHVAAILRTIRATNRAQAVAIGNELFG